MRESLTFGHESGKILASATTGLEKFIRDNGGDADWVVSKAGLGWPLLASPNEPIDLKAFCHMLEIAAEQTGNSNFGLWYGHQYAPQALGVLGFIVVSSPTLGAALLNFTNFFQYHQQVTAVELTQRDEFCRFDYKILNRSIVQRRQDTELTMAIFGNIARHCLGIQWAPEEVQFEHPRPPLWREHERVFKARVRFSQPTNAVVFRNDTLDRPMPHGDLKLLDILCASMIALDRGHAAITFLDRAMTEIRARLPDGNPCLDDISASLGIARWTLQRRLVQENLTFSELVALTRKELALKYIAQRYIPISEIATLLGYSETSAFTRAFKAWTGISPNKHRNASVR